MTIRMGAAKNIRAALPKHSIDAASALLLQAFGEYKIQNG